MTKANKIVLPLSIKHLYFAYSPITLLVRLRTTRKTICAHLYYFSLKQLTSLGRFIASKAHRKTHETAWRRQAPTAAPDFGAAAR